MIYRGQTNLRISITPTSLKIPAKRETIEVIWIIACNARYAHVDWLSYGSSDELALNYT